MMKKISRKARKEKKERKKYNFIKTS